MLLGVGKVCVHGAIGACEQFERDGHDKEVHLTQICVHVVLVDLLIHIFGIVDRAIVRLKNVLAKLVKIARKILRVRGEIYSRLALGVGIALSFT